MNKLRFWTVLLIVWLCGFLMIERLHAPMNISSFVYVMTAALGVLTLSMSRFTERGRLFLLFAAWAALLVLKPLLGYQLFGACLPITVTESLALGLTSVLAGRVQICLRQFQVEALRISAASEGGTALAFVSGQREIYRELRRARHYDRPLSLITLAPCLDGDPKLLDRLVQEMQRASAHEYLRSRIAAVLSRVTEGCATVTLRGDHFVVSLPEADLVRAEDVLNRMRSSVNERLGISLEAGLASFPDQEVTLHGLLDRAEAKMQAERARSRGAVTPQPSDPRDAVVPSPRRGAKGPPAEFSGATEVSG